MNKIEIELEQRILILDGAMGTMIQTYGLEEKDFRKDQALVKHTVDLKGNFDLLNLTRPDVIHDIHLQYLNAGANILSTNTFGSNFISQEDYKTSNLVYRLNYEGAQIARKAVLQSQEKNPSIPLFVAGAMGPTTKLASLSPDVNNPGFRAITFDQLVTAYSNQANALLAGGVDLFLLETVTDTLNAKAALYALMQLFKARGKQYPIMVSGTITDASGRILSGQTVEAFLISIAHAPLLSIGLNCALGAAELKQYVQTLSDISPFYVSAHPNAGLPNQFGGYDQSATELAELIFEFADNGWLNIVGGCCGTTPAHIKAIAETVKMIPPRKKKKNQGGLKKRIVHMTDQATKELIENWFIHSQLKNKSTFSLAELTGIISKIEDGKSLTKLRAAFEKEKAFYHPEQAMLLNAHIIGRFQYLKTEKKM